MTRSGFKVQNDVVEEKGYSSFNILDLDLVWPNKTRRFEKIHSLESRENKVVLCRRDSIHFNYCTFLHWFPGQSGRRPASSPTTRKSIDSFIMCIDLFCSHNQRLMVVICRIWSTAITSWHLFGLPGLASGIGKANHKTVEWVYKLKYHNSLSGPWWVSGLFLCARGWLGRSGFSMEIQVFWVWVGHGTN